MRTDAATQTKRFGISSCSGFFLISAQAKGKMPQHIFSNIHVMLWQKIQVKKLYYFIYIEFKFAKGVNYLVNIYMIIEE